MAEDVHKSELTVPLETPLKESTGKPACIKFCY